MREPTISRRSFARNAATLSIAGLVAPSSGWAIGRMTGSKTVEGEVDPRFELVKDAFSRNFDDLGEVGAALCIYYQGRPVVDIWGGFKDAARAEPWRSDTIVNVWSVSKGFTTLCVHILVEKGLLDLDTPVHKYWPEFAQNGKERVTPRHILSHTSGLPAFDLPITPEEYYDWDLVTGRLAKQAPLWEPGTRRGYQVKTFGHLAGELIRRVSGSEVSKAVSTEVVEPIGGSFFLGVPEAHDHRVAEVIMAPPQEPEGIDPPDPDSLQARAFNNPSNVKAEIVNSEQWRRAELPGSNGHSDARTIARMYGALAIGGTLDGVRLIGKETLADATKETIAEVDARLNTEGRIALGFALSGGAYQFTPNPRAFGYPGRGGHSGFADPDAGIGFGYVANQMKSPPDYLDPRLTRILGALSQCL